MADYTIDPDTPLVEGIEVLRNAVLVPIGTRPATGQPFLGGVFRADGSFVTSSRAYIEPHRQASDEPHLPDLQGVTALAGTWLYAGRHDLRFGHFLVESLARLWALDHIGDEVAGLAYLPQAARNYGRPQRRIAKTAPILNLLGDLPQAAIFTRPVRFERLIVAPQGCGAGGLAVGCPEFRSFVRSRFAVDVAGSGPGRIYVSRSHLASTPGHILFEASLERALAQEGYHVFHPQEHSLETQIATYRGATDILGAESSAFHMIAYAARTARIGMIQRRAGDKSQGILDQLRRFTDGEAHGIDAVAEAFAYPHSRHIGNALLDPPRLAAAIRAAGLVSQSFALPAPTPSEISVEKDRLSRFITGEDP